MYGKTNFLSCHNIYFLLHMIYEFEKRTCLMELLLLHLLLLQEVYIIISCTQGAVGSCYAKLFSTTLCPVVFSWRDYHSHNCLVVFLIRKWRGTTEETYFFTLVELYLIIYLTASYTHSYISYIGWAILKSVYHYFKYCNLEFCHLPCSTEEVFEEHHPLTAAGEIWCCNFAFSHCHKASWQSPSVM